MPTQEHFSRVYRPGMMLLFLCLGTFYPWSKAGPVSQEPLTGKRVSTNACWFERGQVFFVSSMNADGNIGWFLCLDEASNASWLYRPSSMIRFHMDQSGPGGIKLTSGEVTGGRHYTLEIVITGRKIQGRLVMEGEKEASQPTEYLIEGDKVPNLQKRPTTFPYGRYSNAKYVEETGDAIGTELILIPGKNGAVGLIKFNESYWGEPEFSSLALSNIRVISEKKFEFMLKLEGGLTGKYVATRAGHAITLRRTDIPSAPDAEPVILQRQPDLLPEIPGK